MIVMKFGGTSVGDRARIDEVAALVDNTLSDATPADLGTAAPGTSSEISRADHVHAHGTIASGDLHPEYQEEAEKGAANGYAGLDGAGRVPDGQAPDKAVYSTGGGQALAPGDIGASPALTNVASLLQPVPAFGALQTAPGTTVIGRLITGSWLVANTAANAAQVALDVETGVGTGIYSEVMRLRLNADPTLMAPT